MGYHFENSPLVAEVHDDITFLETVEEHWISK